MLILVFLMKDLGGLYQEILWDLDESEEIINNINVARLIEEALKGIHTLRAEKWKTLDEHVSKALLLRVPINTAVLCCLELQRSYVLSSLLHPISTILEGASKLDNYNANSNNIIVNISQTWNI